MFFVLFTLIFVSLAVVSVIRSLQTHSSKRAYPQFERSHQFHEPVGEYEQDHEDRIGKHLVDHPEPEPGYIVLNGIKRKIEDCKYL